MNEPKVAKYLPLTESTYYILLVLQKEKHGYLMMQEIERITNGRIKMGPGTLYGALSKLEKNNLIYITREEDKRKLYMLTESGIELLKLEIMRIRELYENGLSYSKEG